MKNTLLLLALAAITAHGQELIVNGGFETDAVAAGSYLYVTNGNGNTITGWTVTQGDVDIVGEDVHLGHVGTTTSQCLDLYGLGKGHILQEFATTIGTDYLVSFSYSENYDESTRGRRVFLIAQVPGAVGASVRVEPRGVRFPNLGSTLTNDAPVVHSEGWTTTNFTFTATAESHEIWFGSNVHRASGGPLIDDVSVTAVVE